MLELVADTIPAPDGSTINWSHSRDDIVDGVDSLFAALDPQAAQEQKDEDERWRDLMEQLSKVIEQLATVVGEEVVWPVTLGVALLAAELFAISDGYRQAAEEIKRDRASKGFMEGLVMGVMREKPQNVIGNFLEQSPESGYNFEEAGKLAQTYYNGGLTLGYEQGTRVALRGLGQAFWNDVKNQIVGPVGDPDPDQWSRDWVDFYIATGGAFYRGHITE